MHEKTCFITLTYDEENLPKDGSLDVRHWQLFAKKLRQEWGPFRFFHCGEYGGKNFRPHAHAILYGIDFLEDRKEWSRTSDKVEWKSEHLEKIWGKGSCLISSLTFDSAAYVAGYVMKKIDGPKAWTHYDRVTPAGECVRVKPEYITMSRGGTNSGGGLGRSWFEKYWRDVFPEDVVIMKGQRWRPPSFYDSMLKKKDPKMWVGVQAKREEKSREQEWNGTEARLRVRETVQRAKQMSRGKLE